MAFGFGISEEVFGLFALFVQQMRNPYDLQPIDLPLIPGSSAPVTAFAGPLKL